ncbi:HAUS augmin-like complex subunit 8 isoform X1 [Nothobranchius furzeri]|uniref:HAUS augmin-like complex subunit 8 isoform X1 n=1 Tax=Nothobranchius furzeri TaxID=105023 RepID=UPI0039049F89
MGNEAGEDKRVTDLPSWCVWSTCHCVLKASAQPETSYEEKEKRNHIIVLCFFRILEPVYRRFASKNMASRRKSAMPSSFSNASSDTKSTKSGNASNKANNSGNGMKTVKCNGSAVRSRYLQPSEKASLSKTNSLTDSFAVPQRPSSPKPTFVKTKVGTPPRRSMPAQALAAESTVSRETGPSLHGKSILQSTFSDGHCFRPDFDISVIKDKTVIETAAEPDKNPETEKQNVEMQTFLLAYLTAKMENNTTKFKAEAEERIFQGIQEEMRLHNEVKEKKRQYLLAEKRRLMNEMLDLQIEILTPVAKAAKEFTNNYKGFATAVDATRHELPIKNFYINGDGREFLDKAEAYLKETETLLLECSQGDPMENSTSLDCLRDMKIKSKEISQQLSGTFSELQELSSLVCRHSVYSQQAMEEEQLGSSRTRELFCLKH